MTNGTNRRTFLKGAGAALGGLALPKMVSAKSADKRYIVDLKSASKGVLDGLNVVHDLSQIDLAVVEADEAQAQGKAFSKDVEMKFDFAAAEDDGNGDEPGPRKLSQLQWDKQSQGISQVHGQTRGEGTRVAVLDSGAIPHHPDLKNALNTDLSRNFTGDGGDFTPWYNEHGTHVAGIIAGDDTNDEGVVGTAPGTELVALRVFIGPFAFFGDIIAAMTYAGDIESDVANMSLGTYPMPDDESTRDLKKSIERVADYAASQGTLMVAAAGNDGTNLDTDGDVLSLPNEAENVMSVGATGPVGYRWDDKGNGKFVRNYRAAFNKLDEAPTDPAPYTNYGSEAIDVSAPGGNYDTEAKGGDGNWQYDMVLSTVFEWGDDGSTVPDYGWKSGTSMAAPQVTAAAALVKSQNPDATPAEVREHLESTARDVGQAKYHGEGHLDIEAAVNESI
ncbi:S8 family serine peptidase [Halorussus gelatinilyticus]|uniref:S8 family serine peptidase n=1 Tax=Halorussus gelatinilyticus TaxID=2937524 RepID=A0A8U0IIS0_9EURY|nr:S8 family serine peptidase [Halorussus gelatinilyticus]UPW00561.1 S8 family serine peptidase [Halorussus gelatinilyticus]